MSEPEKPTTVPSVDSIVRRPVDKCPACGGAGLLETWCDDNDYFRMCPVCQGNTTVACCGNCRHWTAPTVGPFGKCNAFNSSTSQVFHCGSHRYCRGVHKQGDGTMLAVD